MSKVSASAITNKTLGAALHSPLYQRGFALVAEIFVLVLVAALAVAGLSMVVSQQTSVAQDARAIEAELAAQAGLEWGIYQVLTPASNVASAVVAASATRNALPMSGVLADFSVQVGCSAGLWVPSSSVVCMPASGVFPASAVCGTRPYTLTIAASAVSAGASVIGAGATTLLPGRDGFAERHIAAKVERLEKRP